MNVVMTGAGRFVEVLATAEKTAFDDAQLGTLLGLARRGIAHAASGIASCMSNDREPAGLDRVLTVFDGQIAWCRSDGRIERAKG